MVCAWRRLASWAMAGELAAVGELARRRPAPVLGQDGHLDEEVGAALTCRAARLTGLAAGLARLPGTAAALAAGRIDGPRAVVIADETSALDDAADRRMRWLRHPRPGDYSPGPPSAPMRKTGKSSLPAVIHPRLANSAP